MIKVPKPYSKKSYEICDKCEEDVRFLLRDAECLNKQGPEHEEWPCRECLVCILNK